ncbi:MAG: DNA gyrase inhibitor YacG [Pseudomonadota bacterium]
MQDFDFKQFPEKRKKVTFKTSQRACPICRKETVARYRPFCSKRCADIDLGRWLSDGYAIPSDSDSEEDGSIASSYTNFGEKDLDNL